MIIHLSRSLFLYFNYLVSVTAGGPGDIGISSKIMKSHSPKSYMTFWDIVIYSDTLNWSNITPIFEPFTELDLITNFDLIT